MNPRIPQFRGVRLLSGADPGFEKAGSVEGSGARPEDFVGIIRPI